MTKYAVFTCRMTKRLVDHYGATYGVYTLIERSRCRSKSGALVVKEYPALPGLVFCPLQKSYQLRQSVPEHYNVQQLLIPLTDHPQAVDLDDLVRMQTVLNREFGDIDESKQHPEVAIGDHVRVAALGPALRGVVDKLKGGNRARIRIIDGAFKFMDVPLRLLSVDT